MIIHLPSFTRNSASMWWSRWRASESALVWLIFSRCLVHIFFNYVYNFFLLYHSDEPTDAPTPLR
ncbi:hypothetical protein BDZ94DRAFT_1259764 [Collybia nuda]|uniref:Uncharacterized protein n=1 Tax=Collybia nuda TaxID=64659 RepID=A0A9P6CIC2_9AGAR|nr:hypothetical protein BDZ94DRAFT_1259764 [Collybia nuda]